MARRSGEHPMRSRVWRAAAVAAAMAAVGGYGTVARADEPPVATEPPVGEPVETGTVDGAVVAVGLPPVPPTSIVVAVGLPPVPPTSIVVAVGLPPVPPTSVVVAVGPPPVPSSTSPDAAPVDEPVEPVVEPVVQPVEPVEPVVQPVVQADPEAGAPRPLETGASGAAATAIVAGAAVSIGVALRSLGG